MNTSQSSFPKNSFEGAFTLVELLVVLATVAILAVVLLPAIAGTKPNSQVFQCMANQRQLTLGWHMYADDNNDILPPNDYPYQTTYAFADAAAQAKEKCWVVGTMASAFDAGDAPGKTGVSELLDPNSLLSPYVRNKAVYHCPADNYHDSFLPGSPLHVRSYSMNSAVGSTWNSFYANGQPALGAPVGGGWLSGAGYVNGLNPNWLTYGKLSSFSRPGPANTFTIMDESPITINDGAFNASAAATPGSTYLIDYPAGNHNGAAGISFADGHAIVHKWLDSRTYSPPITLHGTQGGTGLQTPDDKDMFYLAPITSAHR